MSSARVAPTLAPGDRILISSMTRYRAYQAQLAGHTIGETFGRAAAFLKQAAPHPVAA